MFELETYTAKDDKKNKHIIEEDKVSQDDEPNIEESLKIFCPYCERHIYSVIFSRPSIWAYVVSGFVVLIFGWIGFVIIPFLWPLMKVNVHKCSICEAALQKQYNTSCTRFREQVGVVFSIYYTMQIVTIRLGSCAIVLTRTYIIVGLILLSLLTFLLSIKWYLVTYGLPDITKGPLIPETWDDYINDCGNPVYSINPLKAESTFEEKYMGKTVKWYGKMHHVEKGILTKNFLYLNMDASSNLRNDVRDIMLIFGKELKSKIKSLNAGDVLDFEATLMEMGKRGKPQLGVLWDFNVTKDFSKLERFDFKRSFRIIEIGHMMASPFMFPSMLMNIIHDMDDDAENSIQFNVIQPDSVQPISAS